MRIISGYSVVMAIFKYTFAGVGIFILWMAVYSYRHTRRFIDTASTAQGTVVGLRQPEPGRWASYFPVFRFQTPSGRTMQFESSSGSSSPRYRVGDQVRVLYEPGRPEHAFDDRFAELWAGTLVAGVMGTMFLGLGGGIIVATARRRHRDRHLRSHGLPVQTELVEVELGTVSYNEENPFLLVTRWQDPATSQVHTFRSEYIWFDPTEAVEGRSITVYLDREDPRRYWVDTSFLYPAGG